MSINMNILVLEHELILASSVSSECSCWEVLWNSSKDVFEPRSSARREGKTLLIANCLQCSYRNIENLVENPVYKEA